MPSILWSAPVPPAAKHPTTWCCHPRASQLGWCSSACMPSPFSSKHNDGHYGHTVLFLFHQTRGHFSKKYVPCRAAFQVISILDTFYCGYRYFCTCFLQHLHRVLCCCSGIELHFSNQSMFISNRQNGSPSWAVWRLCVPMGFILAYYCLYRWTWYFRAFGNCSRMNQTCGRLQCFFWGLGWFL